MKYFLSLDKGRHLKEAERFITIDLGNVNEALSLDNNLKAIYKFTTGFETVPSLKAFLLSSGLIRESETKYDLVVTYQKGYIHSIPVAYACDLEFFDINHLINVIRDNSKKEHFLPQLINHYKYNKKVARELYSFQAYTYNPYADYKFYDVVRSFVDKICFREKDHKRVKDIKGLYDLALFVSRLTNPGRGLVIYRAGEVKTSANTRSVIKEDSPLYYQLEELESRRNDDLDGQMKLF